MMGGIIGGRAPLAVYTGRSFITGNAASYSHTLVPIGTAHSTRRLVIFQDGAALLGALPNDGTVNLTVGGVAATKLLPASSSNNPFSTWVIEFPTGTEATIAYSSANASFTYGHVVVFAVSYLRPTPAMDAQAVSSGVGDTAATTLDVPSKACVVAFSRQNAAAAAINTWSGVTQQDIGTLSGTGANVRWSTALVNKLAADAAYGVSVMTDTGNAIRLTAVSLR